MARRSNGDGTIRRKSNGTWELSIRIAGSRHWLTGATQTEVRRKLDDLKREHHLGQLVAPQRITLSEYLEQWLQAGEADWKPKTLHGYRSIVSHYWASELGHVQLQRLAPSMLSSCYAKWRKARSGGTLLNVHRCLHRALVVAVRWGYLAKNVADAVEPPRAKRHKPDLWSKDQAAEFLAATRGDRWGALWALLLGTGCRLGEAVALRWNDVDLDQGTVSITRSLVWTGGAVVEGTPKTQSGIRRLSLPKFTVDTLREWQAQQRAEYQAKQQPWSSAERIILLASGVSPAPWNCRTAFHRTCRKLGLPPIRRHDCRHLAASLLIADGVPLPAVAQRLGHSSTAVTAAVYSHALKGSDQQVADALERALGGDATYP